MSWKPYCNTRQYCCNHTEILDSVAKVMLDMLSPTVLFGKDWMPLDGAFSLQSCALAYVFAQTVCSAWQR